MNEMEIPKDCRSYFETEDVSDAVKEKTNGFQFSTANISLSNNNGCMQKSQIQNHKSFRNVFSKIKTFIKNKKKSIKNKDNSTKIENHGNGNDSKSPQPQPSSSSSSSNLKQANSILSQSSNSKTNQDKINTSFTSSTKHDNEIYELEEEEEEEMPDYDTDSEDEFKDNYNDIDDDDENVSKENACDSLLALKAARGSVSTIIHSLKELTLPPSLNYNCAMIVMLLGNMDGIDIIVPFYCYLLDSQKAEFIHRFEIENFKNLINNSEDVKLKNVYSRKNMVLPIETEMKTVLLNNNLRCSFEDIQMKVDNYFLWCLNEKSGKQQINNNGKEDNIRALLIYT